MRNRLKTIGIVIAGWTFLALLFTPQTFLLNSNSIVPLTWFQALAFNLVIFYLWAVLTPFVWLMGKWFPLEKKERQHNFINLFVLARAADRNAGFRFKGGQDKFSVLFAEL